jgi:hypothetical protein
MDDSAVTDYIVYKLGKHVSRNDIIFDLCQRTGKSWDQVSALVASVEQQHESRIARQQSPLYLIIAIGVFIVGLYLACSGLFYFVDIIAAGTFGLDPFALRRDYTTFIKIGTGLAMMIGASVGLIMLAKKLLPKSMK